MREAHVALTDYAERVHESASDYGNADAAADQAVAPNVRAAGLRSTW